MVSITWVLWSHRQNPLGSLRDNIKRTCCCAFCSAEHMYCRCCSIVLHSTKDLSSAPALRDQTSPSLERSSCSTLRAMRSIQPATSSHPSSHCRRPANSCSKQWHRCNQAGWVSEVGSFEMQWQIYCPRLSMSRLCSTLRPCLCHKECISCKSWSLDRHMPLTLYPTSCKANMSVTLHTWS